MMQANNTQRLLLNLNEIEMHLISNEKSVDAERINKIRLQIKNNSSREVLTHAILKFIAMASVKYLGDIQIKEFYSPYEWMNYLSKTVELAKSVLKDIEY